jgi:hypothetical protein
MALLSLIIYRPILQSPFGADDIWMSTLPARYDYGTESPIGHLESQVSFWLEQGRLLWVSLILETYIFELLPGRFEYKIYQLTLNCLVAVYLYKTCLALRLSKKSATLAFLTFLSLGQIRPFFDPRVHFSGLQQIVVLSILLITFLLLKHIATRKIAYSILASIALIVSLLIYETIILFVPAWLILLLVEARKQRLKQGYLGLAIFLFSAITFVGFAQFVRGRGTPSSHLVSLDLNAVLQTFKIQFLGTFPSSSFPGSSMGFWYGALQSFNSNLFIWTVLAGLLGILIIARSQKTELNESSINGSKEVFAPLFPVAIASSALFLPALLISITYRWQQELSPGLPYISVYLQQVGFSMLVAIVFQKIAVRKVKFGFLSMQAFVLSVAIFVMIGNFNTLRGDGDFGNSPMIGQKSFGWDREALRLGLNEAEFAKLLNEEIFTYPQQAWTTSDQVSQWAGKRTSVVNQADWWNGKAEPIDSDFKVQVEQLLVAEGDSYDSGSVSIIDRNESMYVESLSRFVTKSSYVLILHTDNLSEPIEACFWNGEYLSKKIISNYKLPLSENPNANTLFHVKSLDYFDPLSVAKSKECT